MCERRAAAMEAVPLMAADPLILALRQRFADHARAAAGLESMPIAEIGPDDGNFDVEPEAGLRAMAVMLGVPLGYILAWLSHRCDSLFAAAGEGYDLVVCAEAQIGQAIMLGWFLRDEQEKARQAERAAGGDER